MKQLVSRELISRYRGSFLGSLWAFATPLFMLAVFSVFFNLILQSKWSTGSSEIQPNFVTMLFTGLMVHAFFSEVLVRAPMSVQANPNFVKKIVFPIEILPLIGVCVALVHVLISIGLLILIDYFVSGTVSIYLFWVPLILLPLVVLASGFSWILALLGVYVRDINQIMGPLTTALLFASPIFYSLNSLPEWLRPWAYLNPITLIVEELRAIIIFGKSPDVVSLAIYLLLGIIIALVGFLLFGNAKKGFADVV